MSSQAPAPRARRVLLSLGSNLGPAQHLFEEALASLAALPGLSILECSPIAHSEAMGPGQPAFANQVALFESTLPPATLLALLQQLERRAGRRAHRRRWGPRILDLDLLRYGELEVESRHLTLPHPGIGRPYLAPLIGGLAHRGAAHPR